MDIIKQISDELGIRKEQVLATVELIDEGNTIPFIARYRKEVTGSLDDEILRKLNERLEYLRALEDRKQTILSSIEEQGMLTDELKKEIFIFKTRYKSFLEAQLLSVDSFYNEIEKVDNNKPQIRDNSPLDLEEELV